MSVKNMENALEVALRVVAYQERICNYSTNISSDSFKGDGYLGKITAVDIVCKDDPNSKKTVSLIIKSAPTNPDIRKKVEVELLFKVEIHAYKIMSIFNQFEIEKGLPPSKIAPKFYHAVSDYNSELLILENLKVQGFKQHDTTIPFDDNHTCLVLSQYGRLHALSFALRNQQPKKYDELIVKDDVFSYVYNTLKSSYTTLLQRSLEALDPLKDGEAVKVFRNFVENVDLFLDEVSASNYGEHTAFLHGDCWMNNMMFKYDDPDEAAKPTEVRLYDYQVCRSAIPVLDLAYFFYSDCSTEAFDCLDRYLNIYYESFCLHVKKLGSDPFKLYPYSILKEHWKKYARYALILTPVAIQVMAPEGKNRVDLKTIAESEKDIGSMFAYAPLNNEIFNIKMRSIILHFVKNNFL